jgi:exodeoxyribonuclease-3
MSKFLDNGYADTFRHFNQEPNQYTWWSYRTNARERNIGWRIDYFCVNNSILPKVKESSILAEVYGSDHCPVKLKIDLAV